MMNASMNEADFSWNEENTAPMSHITDISSYDDVGGDLEATQERYGSTHDLPTPEEYRSSMMTGIPSQRRGSMREDDGLNEATTSHDQLPSVEDYKVSTRSIGESGGRKWRFYVAILALILAIVTIAVSIVRTQGTSESKKKQQQQQQQQQEEDSAKSVRRSQILNYLVDSGISTRSQLLDMPDSAQSRAFEWIITDEFQLDIPTEPVKYSRFAERYTLGVLYFSTLGDRWIVETNFLQPIDHCDWFSVFVSPTLGLYRIGISSCEDMSTNREDLMVEDLMVTEIDLGDGFNLMGSIPKEIEYLPHLKSMFIPNNPSLGGTLDFLPRLRKLQIFAAQYCGFSGGIPNDIGDLQELAVLFLGNNDLEGSLPDGFFRLGAMVFLGLDDNLLSGDIRQFSALTRLQGAFLEDNFFTGSFSDELITAWSQNMAELDLSRNSINSTIPAALLAMPNLLVLDLHGNHLRGSIPDIVTNPEKPSSLVFLALHDNKLTGVIPESIGTFSPGLRHLDLSNNSLISPLPDTLGQLSNLTYLFLGENDFSRHKFPDFLFSLTNLKELSMKKNKLIGTIPSKIRTLPSLNLLDLHMNQLVGPVPKELGLLTGLNVLLLNRNKLSGRLPSSLKNLTTLDVVLIDHNNITGDASVICHNYAIGNKLFTFVADCKGPEMNIDCDCCSECCDERDATCNDKPWDFSLDPIWEYGYIRVKYQFNSEEFSVWRSP